MALEKTIKYFKLELYANSTLEGEPEYTCEGSDDEWLNYQHIYFHGFDGKVTVSLQEVWRQALKVQKESYTAAVVGLETIIKYSKTMQLKTPLTAKLTLEFRGEESKK